jgi:hypothetical protein
LVRADGTICENEAELEEMATNFYEDLYKADGMIGIEEVYHMSHERWLGI